MLKIIKLFFKERAANPWIVLVCLIFAGLAGGIGFASIVPLLGVATQSDVAGDSGIAEVVGTVFNAVGMEPTLGGLVALVIMAITIKSVLTLAAMRYVGYAAAGLTSRLRGDLLQKLLHVRWSYFASQPLGRIAHSVGQEARLSGRMYSTAANFLANIIQAIIYVAIAVTISWKFSLLAVGFGLMIAVPLQFLVRAAKRAGYRETHGTRDLITFLTDALNSIKPLKAMAKQDHFARLCQKRIRLLNRALRRQVLSLEARRSFQEVLTVLCLGTAFFIAIAIYNWEFSEVIGVGILLSQTIRNIGRIQDGLQKAVIVESPYEAITGLIAEAGSVAENASGQRMPTFEQGCSLEAVSFAFGDKRVLKDVSLHIPAGRTTVLIGPSGSGKTTLTDLIIGLYPPTEGRVLIDGVPIVELDIENWRRMIGYVPQELVLFHDSVFANVTVGNDALDEDDVRAALEMAGAWEFVRTMSEGMMSTVGEKGWKLSGGQRQRIALARALATKPRLLILDEVTSGLDPATEADLCRSLTEISRETTIVAITHRPAFLEIADKVFRVEEGRVDAVSSTSLEPTAVTQLA